MTFSKSRATHLQNPTEPHPKSVLRSPEPAFNDVEQAIDADRRWFAEHPETNEYIREFCPGEFNAEELPEIPSGFRYATLVTVIHRTNGVADGRYRQMIAVCDEPRSDNNLSNHPREHSAIAVLLPATVASGETRRFVAGRENPNLSLPQS